MSLPSNPILAKILSTVLIGLGLNIIIVISTYLSFYLPYYYFLISSVNRLRINFLISEEGILLVILSSVIISNIVFICGNALDILHSILWKEKDQMALSKNNYFKAALITHSIILTYFIMMYLIKIFRFLIDMYI